MMPSLFSAVSGLKGNQEMMNVIGNNIANVNTPGFKASQVNFADLLSQTIKGASLPTSNIGGTNPIQVGQGMSVASIDTIFNNCSMQQTGKSTDLGINGDGLFILGSGTSQYYTRNGDFGFDSQGNLVSNGNGMYVQGWMPDATGAINTNDAPANITLNLSASTPAAATSSMTLAGNLNAELNNGTLTFANGSTTAPFAVNDGSKDYNCQITFTKGTTFNTWNWAVTDATSGQSYGSGTITLDSGGNVTGYSGTATIGNATLSPPASGSPNAFTLTGGTFISTIPAPTYTPPEADVVHTVYDALGNQYSLDIRFTKNNIGNWTWNLESITDSNGRQLTLPSPVPGGTVEFDGTGKLVSGGTASLSFDPNPSGSSSIAPVSIALDLSQLTQDASATTATVQSQNGYAFGTLQSFTIDQTGTVMGVFSNGVNKPLAQIALADFPNPSGLAKAGGNVYMATANSGAITIKQAGTGNLGTIQTGSLEMSNVDLAQEMSNMIIAQSGFEANSKVITTSNQMLQSLVNMIPG
jgi:flagellar hook protein FlgE